MQQPPPPIAPSSDIRAAVFAVGFFTGVATTELRFLRDAFASNDAAFLDAARTRIAGHLALRSQSLAVLDQHPAGALLRLALGDLSADSVPGWSADVCGFMHTLLEETFRRPSVLLLLGDPLAVTARFASFGVLLGSIFGLPFWKDPHYSFDAGIVSVCGETGEYAEHFRACFIALGAHAGHALTDEEGMDVARTIASAVAPLGITMNVPPAEEDRRRV